MESVDDSELAAIKLVSRMESVESTELAAIKTELVSMRGLIESIAAAVVPIGPRNDDGSI